MLVALTLGASQAPPALLPTASRVFCESSLAQAEFFPICMIFRMMETCKLKTSPMTSQTNVNDSELEGSL